MRESDWKKIQAMLPTLRERYLAARNARITAILADPAKTETDRFWTVATLVNKEAKVLHDCLDGHSRSKMWLYMLNMIRAGMLTREDISGFSEELQKEMAYVFTGRKG